MFNIICRFSGLVMFPFDLLSCPIDVGGWMANARVVAEVHVAMACVAFVPLHAYRFATARDLGVPPAHAALFAWLGALAAIQMFAAVRARGAAMAWRDGVRAGARPLPAWQALKVASLLSGAMSLGPLSALAPSIAAVFAMPLVPLLLAARPIPRAAIAVLVAAATAPIVSDANGAAEVLWAHVESAYGDPNRSLLWIGGHAAVAPAFALLGVVAFGDRN